MSLNLSGYSLFVDFLSLSVLYHVIFEGASRKLSRLLLLIMNYAEQISLGHKLINMIIIQAYSPSCFCYFLQGMHK